MTAATVPDAGEPEKPVIPTSQTSIYHLHPLLAGAAREWNRHFERCARMGFSHVLIAPPFLPGRGGNIFLTADHARLNPILGGGDAPPAIANIVETARSHGLEVMLDLVIDRLAADAALLRMRPHLRAACAGPDLPDPRRAPIEFGSAPLDFSAHAEELVAWWHQLLTQWRDAGVIGFRCDSPGRVPATVWRDLISRLRKSASRCTLLAWTSGLAPDALCDLAETGFDFACSSSWAWNFRDDWLDQDTSRIAKVGKVLAVPELSFGPRLARAGEGFGPASRRAAMFAAEFGQAWLVPMGFEFGAHVRLDPVRDRPQDFTKLADLYDR